jgi:hypothetical protein
MKLLITLLLISGKWSAGQSIIIDSCGLDTNSKLNKYEVEYFNTSLEKQRGNFSFDDKKIAFAYDNFGKIVINKKEYFERWGRKYFNNHSSVSDQLIILTSDEKEIADSYDAIIISWSKIKIGEKEKQRIIKKLSKKNG